MLRREWKGLGITSPFPIARYDSARGLVGTGLWAMDKMYDGAGNLVDFYVEHPSVLKTTLRLIIRHRGLVAPNGDANYAMYANARTHLVGPVAQKSDLPPLNWAAPSGTCIGFNGANISSLVDHYSNPVVTTQDLLQPGYYRLETYAAAGTDAWDTDGLAEIPDYSTPDCAPWSQAACHQFTALLI